MKDFGKTKKFTFILFVVTIIVLIILLKDDFDTIINNLLLANKWYILGALLLMVIYWLIRTLCLHMIAKEYNPDIKFKRIFHQTMITQFFNGVTPFSSGGQPMQVYMLNKSNIKVGNATNIIVQEFLMYQAALIVMGLIALFINMKFELFSVSPLLAWLIILGFVINIVVGLCLLFVSFSKKFNDFVGKLVIKIGTKLRIVKDKEKVIGEWEDKLDDFSNSAKLMKKKKFLFFRCFLYQLIGLAIFYAIPFFVFMSLDSSISIPISTIIVSSAFVLIIGNFVPIPGGSGGIEYGFMQFFGSFISNGALLSSCLIIWRFITYYLGMIIGGIALNFFKKEGIKK